MLQDNFSEDECKFSLLALYKLGYCMVYMDENKNTYEILVYKTWRTETTILRGPEK